MSESYAVSLTAVLEPAVVGKAKSETRKSNCMHSLALEEITARRTKADTTPFYSRPFLLAGSACFICWFIPVWFGLTLLGMK